MHGPAAGRAVYRRRAAALDPGLAGLQVPTRAASSSSTCASAGSTPSTSSAAALATSCSASSPPTCCGREVVAGPVEATALGNVLVQALALGELDGLADMRRVVARSVAPRRYEPHPAASRQRDLPRFLETTGLSATRAARAPVCGSKHREDDSLDRYPVRISTAGPPAGRQRSRRARDRAGAGRFAVETPSWGYGDSGTRFGVFAQPGRPRDVFEKIDDAAEVHRLTGAAPAVALHFPWDVVDDFGALREHAEAPGCGWARSTPTCSRTPTTGSARSPTPMRGSGARRSTTCWSASRSRPSSAPPPSRCGWPTAPTTPGQDDLRARRRAARGRPGASVRGPARRAGAARRVQALRARVLRHRHRPTGARRCCCARRSASARGCWSISAITPRASTSSRSSRMLAARGAAGRLSLQQPQVRRRRPHRRLGQPVRAVPDLRRARRRRASCRASRSTSPTTSRPRSRRWCSAWSTCRSPTPSRCSSTAPRWRAAQGDGDVLARPRAPARRLQHRRAPAVRQGPRRARRGRGSDRAAARVGLRRARGQERAGAPSGRQATAPAGLGVTE